uniref:PHD-type domain-containing protein n=1 Tax=Oryza rufipogon TaxID=4529 RepID=A0A0E0P2L9_ORYRU
MAKTRQPQKRVLESFTIKGPDGVIKPGDTVLMMAPDSSKKPYVARVEEIEATGPQASQVKIKSADTIEGKCYVHTFRDYTKLRSVSAEDFFCRFEYKSATGSFVPDRIAVFCKCEMPYNPDNLMIQCEDCSDWFHPSCVEITIKEAKKLEHFYCKSCIAENGKDLQKSNGATAQSEEKVQSKRRRR